MFSPLKDKAQRIVAQLGLQAHCFLKVTVEKEDFLYSYCFDVLVYPSNFFCFTLSCLCVATGKLCIKKVLLSNCLAELMELHQVLFSLSSFLSNISILCLHLTAIEVPVMCTSQRLSLNCACRKQRRKVRSQNLLIIGSLSAVLSVSVVCFFL